MLRWTAVYRKGLLGHANATYVSNGIYSKHSVFDDKGNRPGVGGAVIFVVEN